MRKVIVVGLVVVLLVGVRLLTVNDEEKDGAGEPLVIEYVGKWGSVNLPNGFRLSLPEGWEHYDEYRKIEGFIFRRKEEVDGFLPNVHVYWRKQRRTLDDWFDLYKSKFQGGDAKVLNWSKQRTAGMPGYWLIYERKSKQKGGKEVVTVTKDWLFKGRGDNGGILRGISTARTFTEPYHAIFNEVHRRLKRN